jgi:hypothetical protein
MEETKRTKPHQYYVDLYDKMTVEKARRYEAMHNKMTAEKMESEEPALAKFGETFNEIHMYFFKGEEYYNKEATIKKWIERDEALDKFIEETQPLENITCLTCGRLTFVMNKTLDMSIDEKKLDRILFMYQCPLNHLPHRAFYNDGTEYRPKVHGCPKCNGNLFDSYERVDDVITTTTSCDRCNHKEISTLELNKKEEPVIDPDFVKDRERFCLNEEEGKKYLNERFDAIAMSHLVDDMKKEEKLKPLREKVANIKKITIPELETILAPIFEENQYIKFHLKDPEVGRELAVPFVAYDGKSRNEYDSSKTLEKLIKKALEGTNWRLMSDGVRYRLGMLEGRLRAYEKEEDLFKLVK